MLLFMMQPLVCGVAGVHGLAAVVLATEAHVHVQGPAREELAVQDLTLTHKTAIHNPAQVSMTTALVLTGSIHYYKWVSMHEIVSSLRNFQHTILKAGNGASEQG